MGGGAHTPRPIGFLGGSAVRHTPHFCKHIQGKSRKGQPYVRAVLSFSEAATSLVLPLEGGPSGTLSTLEPLIRSSMACLCTAILTVLDFPFAPSQSTNALGA